MGLDEIILWPDKQVLKGYNSVSSQVSDETKQSIGKKLADFGIIGGAGPYASMYTLGLRSGPIDIIIALAGMATYFASMMLAKSYYAGNKKSEGEELALNEVDEFSRKFTSKTRFVIIAGSTICMTASGINFVEGDQRIFDYIRAPSGASMFSSASSMYLMGPSKGGKRIKDTIGLLYRSWAGKLSNPFKKQFEIPEGAYSLDSHFQ